MINISKEYDLYIGDCIEIMKSMDDGSINCCVTSPPYFGLRDYGVEGQIGLENTPEEYIQKLTNVFREVRRILRDDGTLWLNIGDSYGKDKSLIGIPWLLAFALRADGWYLRQDIIWHKPNAMPESVRDRCTKSHEYVFLLSKAQKYFFDHEAFKEEAVSKHPAGNINHKYSDQYEEEKHHSQIHRTKAGLKALSGVKWTKRNRRSVWSISTKPYKDAHFATFPPGLVKPCILAACPEGGTVIDPFGGSGTTAGVAISMGRKAILCEINHQYAHLVNRRIESIVSKAVQHD